MFIIVLCKQQSINQLLVYYSLQRKVCLSAHTKKYISTSKTNKVANPIKGAHLHGLLLKNPVLKMSARKSIAAFSFPLAASHLAPTDPPLAMEQAEEGASFWKKKGNDGKGG